MLFSFAMLFSLGGFSGIPKRNKFPALLAGRSHGLPQLVLDRRETVRDLKLLAHKRFDFGVFRRGCYRLAALPLGVVDHLGTVEVHVEVGGAEPGHVPYGLVRRTHERVQQPLGTFGSNRVCVDDRDVAGTWVEGCEAGAGL
jgi:hypothetical protein